MTVIVALGALVAVAFHWEERSALNAALEDYRKESRIHTREVARRVESTLSDIYSGLRTMARLPGVRALDPDAQNFTSDAHTTVQEIYNNLAARVSMSEVYLVPRAFDPEAIDPRTGQPQTPSVTFDELIVGRTGGQSHHHAEATEIEEVEIFEYRLMRRQLDFFAARFPNEEQVAGLRYPAHIGPEVVTCDNTRYDPAHPNDADRSGLVYSVPFYGEDGALRGQVSGVILSAVLANLLPGGNHALRHATASYVVGSPEKGPWRTHRAAIERGQPATDLLYTEVVDLAVPDLNGGWQLWAGQPDALFLNRSDVRAAHIVARLGYFATLLVTLLMILWTRAQYAGRQAIEAHNEDLERTVADRTQALRDALATAEEATRAKSQFLANMSHEIRTPINGMLGMNEILLQTGLNERQRHCAETIRGSGAALLDVVNDVLDFSKIEAGMMSLAEEDFDLRELLEELAALLCDGALAKGLRLHVDIAPALATQRRGDAARLRQVLTNLVGNAIKFTPRGRVVLRAEPGTTDQSVRIAVQDTGIGIAEQDQALIFAAFAQADGGTARRYGGTGLGLSISARLVALMGGKITVTSTPGLGSEFAFDVRMSPAAAPAPQPAPLGLDVLLIEADERDRGIAAGLLELLGCRVTALADLAAAQAHRPAAGAKAMDAVLVGHHGELTQTLASAEALRALADLGARRVVAAPLRHLPSHAAAEADGINGLLAKPLRLRDLRAVLVGASAAADTADEERRFHGRVLLVEDNLVNQEVACALLELTGVTVVAALDGESAVAAWAEGPFDLVLMDCQMPGMSGYEATAEIRRRETDTRTPIVALTANALLGDRERCLAAGMDDYLAKPFGRQDLEGVLARWLGGPASLTEPAPRADKPLLNPQALDELRAQERAGRGGRVQRVVEAFLAKSGQQVVELREACVATDAERAGFALRGLRSGSDSVGAAGLKTLCDTLSRALQTGNAAEVAGALAQLERQHAEVSALLRSDYLAQAA